MVFSLRGLQSETDAHFVAGIKLGVVFARLLATI
jgi:hypothetical protein